MEGPVAPNSANPGNNVNANNTNTDANQNNDNNDNNDNNTLLVPMHLHHQINLLHISLPQQILLVKFHLYNLLHNSTFHNNLPS